VGPIASVARGERRHAKTSENARKLRALTAFPPPALNFAAAGAPHVPARAATPPAPVP